MTTSSALTIPLEFVTRNRYIGGMSPNLSDYLTTPQAAKRLGIGVRAVQTICAERPSELHGAVKIGRDWWIPVSSVSARLQAHGKGPIPQKRRRNRQRKANAV